MAGEVPQTSIDAYVEGIESGQHERMLDRVHGLLLERTNTKKDTAPEDWKPITRAEFKEFCSLHMDYRGATEPWVNKLYELKERGRARILYGQDRECSVTHNVCQVWIGVDVPDRKISRVKGLTNLEMRLIVEWLPILAEYARRNGVTMPYAFQRLEDWLRFRLICDDCGAYPCTCAKEAPNAA